MLARTVHGFLAALLVTFATTAAAASDATSPPALEPTDPEPDVLAEYVSTYAVDARHEGRAHNVELAAQRLDGVVLEAGAELSFNERIGPRTEDTGFRRAPEIRSRRMRAGVGGGVCQVATGLFVSALRGGLEVLEHRTHSTPRPYAPEGFDAAVFYGRIDLRVRNPHAFAVRVEARAVDGAVVVRLVRA